MQSGSDLPLQVFEGSSSEALDSSGLGYPLFMSAPTRALRRFLFAILIAVGASNAAGATPSVPEYQRDIRPLMERRCLVCHGCYDAPCQLKLDSYQGLSRGGSKERIYSTARLSPAPPSRLFEDAQTTAEWRAHGFSPVLPDRPDASEADRRAGVLARMLDLKKQHPLPTGKVLPETFDFSLSRAQQCPRVEDFNSFATRFPQWGMPYGLPAVSDSENSKFTDWLAAGAPADDPPPLSPSLAKEVEYWETLFNGTSLKHQLAARYVYEHLFLAHLYLEDQGANTVFFKVVRSRTPPGTPLDMIATRRPYDDPGVPRVYYRLWRDPASVVAKTHMPYQLTAARRDRWRKWFIDADYTVDELPGYGAKTASNPFYTFQRIPYSSRHSFMLDEAQFTIMNFIKGPVCRGNVALSVIQDRFWVFFTTPHSAVGKEFSQFLSREGDQLKLPAGAESGIWSVTKWHSYAHAQRRYLKAKGDFIRSNATALESAGLNTFWDGYGTNANAALTVFRHNDSATVVQGLVGTPPQTAWLIDYPILERIHYLLVAGFDVYGTASHQLMTRMYMDFLRMESEMNFLGFLPQDQRIAEVGQWYRGADRSVHDYLNSYYEHGVLPAPFDFKTDQPKAELFRALQARMAKVLNHRYELQQSGLSATSVATLARLDQVRGVAASIMPQTVIIKINGHGLLSLLSNTAYANISSIFNEDSHRLPAEDSLTIANGVVGAYPNIFLQVSESEIPELVMKIEGLRSEADYSALLDRFGIRRTDERFWAVSDQVLADYQASEVISHGVLDYSRYENR
jgi:hypothetical protein